MSKICWLIHTAHNFCELKLYEKIDIFADSPNVAPWTQAIWRAADNHYFVCSDDGEMHHGAGTAGVYQLNSSSARGAFQQVAGADQLKLAAVFIREDLNFSKFHCNSEMQKALHKWFFYLPGFEISGQRVAQLYLSIFTATVNFWLLQLIKIRDISGIGIELSYQKHFLSGVVSIV